LIGFRALPILASVASEHSNRGAKRARQARADLGFTRDGPLPDVLAAVEHGGAHAVVLELPEGVAGAYVNRPGCALLFVNGAQAVARQRFTLAHEFGHHRMGHASVVDEQATISGNDHDPNEVCANAFAAEFLMPRDAIAAWGREHVDGAVTLEHVVLLAADYGVSAQAARYALASAKVLIDARRGEQLDAEIAQELHVALGERLGALEDELADVAGRLPRIPIALRGSALGDLLAGEIDPAGLAQRTGRSLDEVSAMLAALGLDRLLPASP
jgi:Zn-dependent peptidase ImmA (M78 family)